MTGGRGQQFWWGVGAGVAVLIVLVGWLAAISPQLGAATTARDDADQLQVQNQALRSSVATLEKKEPGPLRASLSEAVSALPYDSDLPTVTRQLTEQAQQTHVVLGSIVIGSTAATGGAPTDPAATSAGTLLAIPITLSSTGTGADQRAFLRAIQVQGPRRALISGTQLSPAGGDDGTIAGRSTMTTTLTTFVAPLTGAARARLQKLLRGDSSS